MRPNQGAAANQRPAGQSAGRDNLLATVAIADYRRGRLLSLDVIPVGAHGLLYPTPHSLSRAAGVDLGRGSIGIFQPRFVRGAAPANMK